MATFTTSFTLSGGWQLTGDYTQTSGQYYFPSGSQNDTLAKTISFADIPAGARITSVTINWGSASSSSMSINSRSNSPTEAALMAQLNAGEREIRLTTNATLKWSSFRSSSITKWMAWSVGTSTITVDYDDDGAKPYTVKYGTADGWIECYAYYGVGGIWKQCQAYYGTEEGWKPTNHQ